MINEQYNARILMDSISVCLKLNRAIVTSNTKHQNQKETKPKSKHKKLHQNQPPTTDTSTQSVIHLSCFQASARAMLQWPRRSKTRPTGYPEPQLSVSEEVEEASHRKKNTPAPGVFIGNTFLSQDAALLVL